jgi:CRP-like cAMP-binding protein
VTRRRILTLLDDMKFIKTLWNFEDDDKIELLKLFTLCKVKAGTRINTQSDYLDHFYIILSGKVGIFYPDQ